MAHTLGEGPVTIRMDEREVPMVIETDGELAPGVDGVAALATTERILHAVDAFEPDARSRERARNVGLTKVFVLFVGMALVLATVVTLHQLVTETVRSVEHGM
jgi:hypothetical protein